MGKASVEITKISFDFTDSQVTEVTVEFIGHGDVPFQLTGGQRKKNFPARLSAVQILEQHIAKMEYLEW